MKSITKTILIGLACLIITFSSNAQFCIGNNGFLKGNFLELGISECGSFGPLASTSALPSSYHNNWGPQGALGAVADAAQDGWTSGIPNYCGDYFLPGSPVEGWGIEFNGEAYTNGNAFSECNSFDILRTGACSISGNNHTWRGSVVNEVYVIQRTRILNPNDLFAVIEVQIINKTKERMNNVFYARNTDPDNGLVSNDTYTTTNSAENTPCSNLVTATSNKCFLALASADSRASVSYGGFFMDQVLHNYSAGFGSPPLHNFTGTNTADEAIAIGFNLGTIPPGGSVSFKFAYVFSETHLATALLETGPDNTPCVITANGVDISTNPSTSIACGKNVNLTITQSNYTWAWSPTPLSVNATGTNAVVAPTTTTVYTITGTGICGTISKQITVVVKEDCCEIKPNFKYKVDKNCGVHFSNSSSSGGETTVLGVLWDFGDGNTSTAWNPIHYYTSTGTFVITLTLIGVGPNGECCTKTISKKIKMKCELPPCLLNANFDRNYMGGQVFSFNNLTISNSITTIVGYQWEVNGVYVSSSQNLIHTFSKGSHQVCLTVYGLNNKGECCQKTVCKKVCLKRPFLSGWKNCTKKQFPSEPIPNNGKVLIKK